MMTLLLLPEKGIEILNVFLLYFFDHLSISRAIMKFSLLGRLLHVVVIGPFCENV